MNQNKTNPVLSIVIPVYNVAQYLSKCLDTLIEQKGLDYEIILVNDGSLDYSGDICDKYATANTNIHVIHQENSGVSAARNRGLEHAKGKYISFVDADDFVSKEYIHELLKLAYKDVDLGLYNYIRWISDRKQEVGRLNLSSGKYVDMKKLFFEACSLEIVCLSVCLALYKREIIEKYHIRFNKTMKTCEDFMFSIDYYQYIKSFEVINKPLYFYRQNEYSATIKRNLQHGIDYTKVYNRIISILEKDEEMKHDSIGLFNQRWSRWIVALIANFKIQGYGNNIINQYVYSQPYFVPTLQMRSEGIRFKIDHFLLCHRWSWGCYAYIRLLENIKRLSGRYKL